MSSSDVQPPEQSTPFDGASNAITRDRLRDGSLLAQWRAAALPNYTVRSDEEIERSLSHTLASRPSDGEVWVFGYGSLIWNPTFDFAEKRVALLRGWHRRYCLWIKQGRATPERPGLTLALDRGGACNGVAFRIEAKRVEEELLMLWRREMASGVYEARWIDIRLQGAESSMVKAVTFVANRRHERFTDSLTDEQIADCILLAKGQFGTSLEYFWNTIGHLESLGLRDSGLDRLRVYVSTRLAANS
ncbi:gamma-glutamylcyclotransferase [Hydrogenophaga sp. RWCD_12]|uniref:gamma-glutamylcyclotransferase n=1 Tax=Hydrogenophaga sp. RWCD_12 TaxID=3391190 RepID=UPI003984C8D9